ncbi:TIGR01458 family HAD-type hydrolase [Bauldia sp.]|uniref:TIGR01458 family HAD-type hydrolase n=1 Tax=Bauldia sp. TaxID=2575872 RepID=UPI003BAD9858
MIRGVLLDLAGVLYLGNAVLPGAVEAIRRLRDSGLPVRFVTNTTRTAKAGVVERLHGMGFTISASELFTPAEAARTWLLARDATPHLLVHPNLVGDFAGLEGGSRSAVVVGDAGHAFTYETLNTAFRALMDGAAFLALAKNRYFMDSDDALSLDAGAFVEALEYASGQPAIVLGKPAPDFYAAAVVALGCDAADVVMVGDDVEADVSGALKTGIGKALLVRTGKYRPGAEADADPSPTAIVDDIGAAADWILAERGQVDSKPR